MVLLLNTEDSLHHICLMDFKSSLGMLSSSKNDIQSSVVQKNYHCHPSVAQDPLLRKSETDASFKVSQVMGWVKSLNSFEKSTLRHSFDMVNGFKN